jgi:sigma-B regulation protein RsbU (phosphoserine phosphatase)
LIEKNEALEKVNKQISQDLDLAQRMQTAILPAAFPQSERFSGYAMMKAARQVGGDFYDYFMIDQRHLAVVIADVSGKGVPAAFFMAIARTVIQGISRESLAPGETMAKANDLVCRENPLELFVTVFYGILDIETGVLRYANAGHNCPYIVSHTGEVSALEGTGGTACGIMEGLPYEEAAITLAPGDALFMFTDGVTEAFDINEQEYGDARLAAALANSEGAVIEDLAGQVVASVAAFVGAAPQSDDLTCLALRYHGNKKEVA